MPKKLAPNHNENFHVITVYPLARTHTLPPRISINSERFNSHLIIDPSDTNETVYYWDDAIKELQKRGFNIIGKGNGKKNGHECMYIISTTFSNLK